MATSSARGSIKGTIRRLTPGPIWALVRRWRHAIVAKQFDSRWVTHTYHDQRLRIRVADSVAEAWYDHDWPRQIELDRLAKAKLRPGAVVYDCGAHQSVVALVMAGIVGPSGRVVAVEAVPFNLARSEENVGANKSGRAPIELVHAAIAGHDGELRFNHDFNTQAASHKSAQVGVEVVPAVTLNTLSRRYPLPDVMFVDIEGAEVMALSACEDLFRDGNRPSWYVEVHGEHGLEDLGGTVAGIVNYFQDRKYVVEWARPDDAGFQPMNQIPSGRFYLIATDPPSASV